MVNAPLVSVILPTYNRAKVLPRAIHSVLGQTYSNLELIVVDDASTDDTAEVVAAICDPRLRYHRQPRNQRAAAARNVGIELARAELVAFQDDDDHWLAEKLARQVSHLTACGPDVGLSICSLVTIRDRSARYWGSARDARALTFADGMNFATGLLATPAWLARRGALLEAGLFDVRMKAWDDWEYAIRLAKVCRFSHLDEPLLLQDRTKDVSMWNNQVNFANDMRIIMEKHGERWADAPEVLARHWLIAGRSEFLFHSASTGRAWLRQAWRAQPHNRQVLKWLALSLLPRDWVLAARTARLD